MGKDAALRIYKIRLQLAGVQNILDMVQVVASATNASRLEKAKLATQRPFRYLLFALAVRCSRLLEVISLQLETVQPSGKITEMELSGIKEFISAKRKEVSHAQTLLEKGALNAALNKLAKSRAGIHELAEKLDTKIF
jgi:hypothetical protein